MSKQGRIITDKLRRAVEGNVYKLLLGHTPKRPAAARSLTNDLLAIGTNSKSAARVICAAEAEDPAICAREIPDKPRVSFARSQGELFEKEPTFTQQRGAKPAKAKPAKPEPAKPAAKAESAKPAAKPEPAAKAEPTKAAALPPTLVHTDDAKELASGGYYKVTLDEAENHDFTKPQQFTYPAVPIRKALDRLKWCTSFDESRFLLYGVWTVGESGLIATNGHALGLVKTPIRWRAKHRFTKEAFASLKSLKKEDTITIYSHEQRHAYTVHGKTQEADFGFAETMSPKALLSVMSFREESPWYGVVRQHFISAIDKSIAWATENKIKKSDIIIRIYIPESFSDELVITSYLNPISRAGRDHFVKGRVYYNEHGRTALATNTRTLAPTTNEKENNTFDGPVYEYAKIRSDGPVNLKFRILRGKKAKEMTVGYNAGYLLSLLQDSLTMDKAYFALDGELDPIHFLESDAHIILMPVRL